MSLACIAIENFRLRAALGRGRYDPSRPLGLFPNAGRQARLAEVSPGARRAGVAVGMQLGQALGFCQALRTVAHDPIRAERLWAKVCGRLEALGVEVDSPRPGEAFFVCDGLAGLYGGSVRGVLDVVSRSMGAAFDLGAAPSRFGAALAAAGCGEGEALLIAEADLAAFLGPHPVGALRSRLGVAEAEEEALIEALEHLGVTDLARLALLGPDHLADRFGPLGLEALRLARGEDRSLHPAAPQEDLWAVIDLPDGSAGELLDRALDLVVERLLADPERKARTILALRLAAPLVGGGSWVADQTFGRPSASLQTIAPLMRRRLADLPQPASALELRVLAFGPPTSDQLELRLASQEPRRRRLAGAIREVRAAAGPDALLRISDVDPASRVPERRFVLNPRLDR